MAVSKLDSGRIVFSNAAYLHITPYTNEDTIGTTTYDLISIVGDTLGFTPDDNTVNSTEWEFGDSPLFEAVVLGSYQFAANCIDFQNEVMKNIFGWQEAGAAVAAPDSYKEVYAVVEIGFKNEDTVVVAPKLKFNSKANISTLKTGTGVGELSGTAYSAGVTVGEEEGPVNTPLIFIPMSETNYTINTKQFTIGGGVAGA